MQRRQYRGSGAGAAFAGIVIIGIGALFLLQNLGIVYVRDIGQYWPVILIALGISRLMDNQLPFGVVLTAVGAVFLAHNLGYLPGNIGQYLWPAILIGVGTTMLLRGMGVGCGFPAAAAFTSSSASASASPSASSENRLNVHLAFSATERRINAEEFEGGEIHVAFGAAEIDLRNARTKREEIFLDCHAAFGGIELMVPENWIVVLRGHGAFGVFEDKTHPLNSGDQTKVRLIVSGGAAFGGVTVKN